MITFAAVPTPMLHTHTKGKSWSVAAFAIKRALLTDSRKYFVYSFTGKERSVRVSEEAFTSFSPINTLHRNGVRQQ